MSIDPSRGCSAELSPLSLQAPSPFSHRRLGRAPHSPGSEARSRPLAAHAPPRLEPRAGIIRDLLGSAASLPLTDRPLQAVPSRPSPRQGSAPLLSPTDSGQVTSGLWTSWLTSSRSVRTKRDGSLALSTSNCLSPGRRKTRAEASGACELVPALPPLATWS